MSKKKNDNENNKNYLKIKLWKILNIIVIMVTVLFLAISYAKSGVDNSWYNANDVSGNIVYNEEVVNKVSHMVVEYTAINVGLFAFLHILFYILYSFKCKKAIYISFLVVIIVLVTPLAASFDLYNAFFPLISSFIYLRILKLEEE